ncbi:MAG: aldehyde ferredoxin oxidoreductase family protein [Dehalococcoidales bacterium]|nr:aldehyde ferredoxin oxidoreductase family protein [Dehalococcoidales bacterium]
MSDGFSGKFLRVDLTRGEISIDEHDETFWREYMGGWNTILYYLLRETKPGLDPLGSDNLLVFAPGVLTGSHFSGSGRSAVGCKSPLTNGFGAAEVGGFWGAELKNAGWDGIVISGRAPEPKYLWMRDDEVQLRDAESLWGLETLECQEAMRAELGDRLVRTALIGPAGEKLVKYAAIANDLSHFAGRTGVGAVMGSKLLKGIAVRASSRGSTADPLKVQELARWVGPNVKELAYTLNAFGTGAIMTPHLHSGNLPTNNFRDGNFWNIENLSSQTIKRTILKKMDSCYACAVRCKKMVATHEPYETKPEYGGPEYETLAALGSDCGVDDLMAVNKASELCNRYCMDSISVGATIAFAMECFEHGLLTKEDTGGIDLRFGNAKALVQMTEMIAKRQGLGDLLAEGVKIAAQRIGRGAEEFAIHVKGLEVPMHEPRLKRALGVGYAISPTGADHNHNIHDPDFEKPGRKVDMLKSFGVSGPVAMEDIGEDKIRVLKAVTMWEIAMNCLGICRFVPWSFEQGTELVKAVTGWDVDLMEVSRVGERAMTLARIYNLREGLTRKDDWLPDRFFHPATVGPLSSTAVDPEKLAEGISIYYEMLGWDRETGVPTAAKTEDLNVEWAAKTLQATTRG